MYSNNVIKSYVQWSVNLSTMLFRSPTFRVFHKHPLLYCVFYTLFCCILWTEYYPCIGYKRLFRLFETSRSWLRSVYKLCGFLLCYAMIFWFLEHKIEAQSMIKNTLFSSPEPNSQVSFPDHLLSSVRLSVKFSRFRLLFQNHQGKLGTIMWEANSFTRDIN